MLHYRISSWKIDVLVSKVVCGRTHVLALTNKGKVYAWGNNSHGQVGVNNNETSGPTVVTHELLIKNFLIIATMNGTRNRILRKDMIDR